MELHSFLALAKILTLEYSFNPRLRTELHYGIVERGSL